MGTVFSRTKTKNVLMLGLFQSGKTPLLYRMKLGGFAATVSTIDFNFEEVKFKSFVLNIWDVNGRESGRRMWPNYVSNKHAIIFVIDSRNRHDKSLEKKELEFLKTLNIPILIMATKCDLPGSLTAEEIRKELELQGPNIYFQSCSALTGIGVSQGLTWLIRRINK